MNRKMNRQFAKMDGQRMAGAMLCAVMLCAVMLCAGVTGALAEAEGVKEMQITTATIRAEGVDDQTLADSGTFSVNFARQFTLHVEVESKLNLANKKVEITVPDGLTVVEYPIPERGGMAESVTPESIDELHSVNNYGGYRPTNGTITYSLKNTAEKNSFNIVLAPDTVLWNRSSAQVLKDPLKIRVYTDDQTYQTISATPKITGKYNDAVDDDRAIQTGPRLSRVGVKTGVPTAANQPFALRQIWINPDKDYIDMPQFFKKLEVTIALPYYTKNSSNIYAELDHITWDPAGQSTRPNMLDPKNHKDADDDYTYTETKNDTDHTVTLTWTNLYLEYGQDYFTPYFKWASDCDVTTTNAVKWGSALILNTGKTAPGCYEGKTPTTGAASAVGGTITWQDDSTWYLYNGDCTTFSFTAQAGESMSVKGKANNNPIYNYAGDSDIIYYLGQFHVVNQGGAASANKTVEFTYGNNDKIGVTAQKIPATSGNTVTVQYQTTKTVGDVWTSYSGDTLTSSGGFVTFTAQMAGLGEGEYFTKIKANVGSYEKDYVGYVSSRDQDPTSGYATTFGKLLTNEGDTYNGFASMKMYNTGGTGNMVTGKYNVTVTTTAGEIPPGMEQAYKEGSITERLPILSDPGTGLSKTTATAGDTITFNGLLSSSAYPYSRNNIMTDPVIYIRLPEKIKVTNLKLYSEAGRMADKVFLFDAVTETETPVRKDIIGVSLDRSTANAGYNLYEIPLSEKVGWFTDGLGQYQIGISFDMEIAKDAEAMTLDMRDCVRFKSATLDATTNNGTLSQYQVKDTYDMDGDGDNTELFSTFNVNAEGAKLSVVAARLGLTFTFGARMTEKGSDAEFDASKYSNFEEKGDKVYLKDNDHVVDMLFTLKNETGREFSKEDAQAFYYFIPVPKTGDLWDSHMQEKAFEFDMSLTGEPTLSGKSVSRNHIQVLYSTTVRSDASSGAPLHYSTITDNYVTADEITDWDDVKMIRISATKDTEKIPEDADLKVNLRLKPTFSENADLVGSVVNFGPCGVSPYSVGNTLNQGHNPLPRIQAEFQTGIIQGKVFLDKDFDGKYTEGTDALYTAEGVSIYAPHWNGVGETTPDGEPNHRVTTQNGEYQFTGRMADTYHVIVTNPGTMDANGSKPLRFSLPEGSQFLTSVIGNVNKATATVTLRKANENEKDTGTATLDIGLQQPHTVTFEAANATLDKKSIMVWHGDELGENVPTVTVNGTNAWKFTGNWKDSDANTYTTEELETTKIGKDTTFTAEVKQLYSLSYDLNGGSGAPCPETTYRIEGEKVTPEWPSGLNKGEKTIFVGWSRDTIKDILQADAPEDITKKIIRDDEHTMPAENVVLYAVYAADANGNGKPDYNDDSVHVRYHGNNGDHTDVICPHHHVVGGKASLSTSGEVNGRTVTHDASASTADNDVVTHKFEYGSNIFIGWSTTPILDQVIATKAEYDGLKASITTEVTMLDKPGMDVSADEAKDTSKYADADGNTNVYAVWAADTNGNKIADYLEEHKLNYEGNAQRGGTVSNMPASSICIPGKVTLSTIEPTHSDVDSKKVVFIGWTVNQNNQIFKRADTAPETVTEVTFAGKDITVYAAWGYDENSNGTADVLETYSLTYDLNGGSGNPPAQQTGLKKGERVTLTEEKNFFRNDKEVFVGWSRNQYKDAFGVDKKADVDNILITGTEIIMGTENVTLHAVWAVDKNRDGYPDYDGGYYWLEYNGNAGSAGSVSGLPKDNDYYFSGNKVTLSADRPTHSTVGGKSVLFIGWTENRAGGILRREDDAPKTVTEVTFADADITVYAAWGYDENDDGTADVLETYLLTYDLNGGSGNPPAQQTDLKKGDSVPLTTQTGFTRNANEVFVGWSLKQETRAFGADEKAGVEKILITGTEIIMGAKDVTLYAVWAQDLNGNGCADYDENRILYEGNACEGTVDKDTVPVDNNRYMSGKTVPLSAQKPVHAPVNGKNVAFIGWTSGAPVRQLLRGRDEAPATVTEVTLEGRDLTVYAAWGYDENGNGTADVLERLTLTYDLNGGSPGQGMTYEQEHVKYGAVYRIKPAPWREGHTFTGWMDESGILYQAGQELTLSANLRLTAQWCAVSFADLPATGDTSHSALWLTLLGISCAAIALAVYRKKDA